MHGYKERKRIARQKYEDSLDPEFVRVDHCERSRLHRKTRDKSVTDKSSVNLQNDLASRKSQHLEPNDVPAVGICRTCGKVLWKNKGA